jgi:hypothetical protein
MYGLISLLVWDHVDTITIVSFRSVLRLPRSDSQQQASPDEMRGGT